MLKLLIKLLVLPPELLREHARGYADLASQAWQQQLRALQLRWALYALAWVCAVLGLGLGSVSCLLWAALPGFSERHVWVMWALPLTWMGGSGVCFAWARSVSPSPLLDSLQAQLKLDVQALRSAQTA
jgi:hypothetical protein